MGHLRTQIWSTCQNIKKFKVVSRFLLWKKGFEESLHCRKVFVKSDFQGKKFVYSNERKLVWLFVKKIEYGTIIIFVLQKRFQEQKRQQEVFRVSIFVRRKNFKKRKCNAAEVGRLSRILVYCFLVCLKESRKNSWEALSSKLHPIVKIYAFSPNGFSFLSFSFNCWT